MFSRFRIVTLSELGSSGIHFASGSSSAIFLSSTSWATIAPMYVNANAPLRKCMSVVAGTPVIDSPSAAV